jgi:hemolysin activation/secretion protein
MNFRFFLSAGIVLGAASGALAQVAPPNAGQVFRDARQPGVTPPPASGLTLPAGPKESGSGKDAGPSVLVTEVVFEGNSRISSEELRALVADLLGKPHTLEGMRAIARRVGDHYRVSGYPFARALVPAQEFAAGRLRILVLEGRYGKVAAAGEERAALGATPFLEPLRTGEVIHAPLLERCLLLIDDLPGVEVVPVVSPSSEVGAGDLRASVRQVKTWGGEAGVDNHGSRYTGYHRVRGSVYRNDAFTFGDKAAVALILTDESMVLGSADYERPLGGSGLRAEVGYAHTSYELGREFSSLGASGLAKVATARLSYPLVRSQLANLTVSWGYQRKDLEDEFASLGTVDERHSDTFPLSFRFDRRDSFLRGGITYGQVSWTPGTLTLDPAALAVDAVTARKDGGFSKFNIDVARLQALSEGFSLYGRLSAQWAQDNLDTSERLGAGGPEGVRAYPLGEGTGDTGLLAQIEVRYAAGDFAPYVFFDTASVEINRHPWDAASDQERDVSGAGIGVRYSRGEWTGNLLIAWRTSGGPPQSDQGMMRERVLFSATRTF